TTLSAITSTVGTAVHDSATLTGATINASGTVTYTVFSDSTCTTPYVNQPTPATVTVTSGSVPDSGAVTFNSAGTYYWQAVYSGDANNNPAMSPCTSEVLTVTKKQPGISTAQNLIPNDAATITGATSAVTG